MLVSCHNIVMSFRKSAFSYMSAIFKSNLTKLMWAEFVKNINTINKTIHYNC